MRHEKFNEILKSYNEMQAVRIVHHFFSNQAHPLILSKMKLSEERKKLEDKILKKINSLKDLDEEIDQMYSEMYREMDESKGVSSSKENTFLTCIDALILKKKFISYEILLLKNHLESNKNKFHMVFYNPDYLYSIFTNDSLVKAEKCLKAHLKDVFIAWGPNDEFNNKLFTSLTGKFFDLTSHTDFVEELNQFARSSFDFMISYSELLDKITVIASYDWESSLLLEVIRQLLSQRDSMLDHELYQRIEQEAKQAIKDSKPFQLVDDFNEVAKAIATNNLIALEAWIIKDQILNNKTIKALAYQPILLEKVNPILVDERLFLTKTQANFSKTINCYLQCQAAETVLNELIELTEHLMVQCKNFENELIQLNAKVDKAKEQLELYQQKIIHRENYYQKSIEEYPDNKEDFDRLQREEQKESKMIMASKECDVKHTKGELYKKQKEYNTFITLNTHQFSRVITLSKLSSNLEQALFKSGTQLLENTGWNNEEIVIFIKDSLSKDIAITQNFQQRLESIVKKQTSVLSYKDYNNLIIMIINHDYWKVVRKQGKNIVLIKELKKVVTTSSYLSPVKFLDAIENEIQKFQNKPHFFKLSLGKEIQDFIKAIREQDIGALYQLLIIFNFDDPHEQYKILPRL